MFLGSVVESFLNSGFNLAIWQSVGKSEYFMERLHSSEIGFARIFAPSFKNFPERLSTPPTLYSYPLVTAVQGLQSHLKI